MQWKRKGEGEGGGAGLCNVFGSWESLSGVLCPGWVEGEFVIEVGVQTWALFFRVSA